MKAGTGSIQRLLSTLAKHSDLVAEAFAGPVTGGDKQRDTAITELVAIDALKPFEEGTYYLSSGLHDYFSVVLASFHAFQALTRIDGHMRQARGQWEELCNLKRAGANRDMRRLESALERSVIEVGDIVERNIQLLNTMVLGQYGNVDSLNSKLRQNRYYAQEVQTCLKELAKVDSFVQEVTEGSIATGMPRMRQLVQRRLGTQLLPWAARLKDAQAVISRRLFEAKLMERRLKQLARYASWLSSNRTSDGWEVDVKEDADPALFRTEPVLARPQPDITDPDTQNQAKLVEVANKLPPQRAARPAESPDELSMVLSESMETIEVTPAAHELAIGQLREALAAQVAPVSLRAWKEMFPELDAVPTEHWLLFAVSQLRTDEVALRFVGEPSLESFPINESFFDVEVAVAAGRHS